MLFDISVKNAEVFSNKKTTKNERLMFHSWKIKGGRFFLSLADDELDENVRVIYEKSCNLPNIYYKIENGLKPVLNIR